MARQVNKNRWLYTVVTCSCHSASEPNLLQLACVLPVDLYIGGIMLIL